VTKRNSLIGLAVVALGVNCPAVASAKSAPKNTVRAGSALLSTWTDKPTSTVIATQYVLKRYAKGDCLVVKTSTSKTDTWCGTRSSMYVTVDQKIVKLKKSPDAEVICPQNNEPFEVTAKGAIMHGLYEIEFCEELFGPSLTSAPAAAVPPTPVTTTTAPGIPAKASGATTTTPLRNGVVPKDTTPVTAVQKAYANDLASISTGQPATIDYENETWYLSRIINGGGARYVGVGGQCIFTVTPEKPAGAQPVVTYTPDKCINMDRLIDNWIRFPKTAAVPLPVTTTTTAPQFVTNPVINGPAPVVPLTATIGVSTNSPSVATATVSPAAPSVTTPIVSQRLAPSVRVVADPGNYGGSIVYSFPDITGVIGYEVTAAGLGAVHPNPIPLSFLPEYSPLLFRTKYAGLGAYRVSIRLLYSDGTYGPFGISNTCTISPQAVTQFGGTITC
jgi:hypothetical protein